MIKQITAHVECRPEIKFNIIDLSYTTKDNIAHQPWEERSLKFSFLIENNDFLSYMYLENWYSTLYKFDQQYHTMIVKGLEENSMVFTGCYPVQLDPIMFMSRHDNALPITVIFRFWSIV